MEPNPPPGLSTREVDSLRRTHGWNDLPHAEGPGRWRLLLGILTEPMIVLLLLAVAIYVLLGEPRDAIVLGFSLVFVVGLTLVQEWRSEKALKALRDLGSPRARVFRDGALQVVPGRELLPGDRIALAEGDRVPADAQLFRSAHLRVDESLLTGESVPVDKRADAHDDAAGQLSSGTLVVAGHGEAVVIAIGANTRMGRIGHSLAEVRSPPTPLQVEMRRLVWLFGVLSIGTSLLLVILHGSLRGDWLAALLAGVTLAMANIPEEFPVVLAVFLALGAWRMARHRVLVRRPAAIEALGSVAVLCTDKTGTLTENRMAIAELRGPEGELLADDADPLAARLLACAAAASQAATFDPMDRAVLARSGAAAPGTSLRTYPLGAVPMFAQVFARASDGVRVASTKGAPEVVLAACAVDADTRDTLLDLIGDMAARGLRVLGVARAELPPDAPWPDTVDGFAWTWQGLVGFADPLRADVPEAVAEARSAGIRVLMLTGDHAETAQAIARQAGIADRPQFLSGADLDTIPDADLITRIDAVDGFARVRPEHKLRIIRALAARGRPTAMTGDGVNDAPALQAATVGVAMGQRGTEVAREASSIVLLDDDFSSIVRAIRMGRATYERIVQASRYLIAVHVPIVGLALLPMLTGTPMILLPLHIVFLELIIDPACSIAFEREPVPADIMARPPRPAAGRLFQASTLLSSLAQGVLVLVACLAVFLGAARAGLPHELQAGLCFAALVAGNVALIFRFRAGADWRAVLTAPNPALFAVVGLTLLGLGLVGLVPPVAAWFGFGVADPALFLAAVALPLVLVAAADWPLRRAARP